MLLKLVTYNPVTICSNKDLVPKVVLFLTDWPGFSFTRSTGKGYPHTLQETCVVCEFLDMISSCFRHDALRVRGVLSKGIVQGVVSGG